MTPAELDQANRIVRDIAAAQKAFPKPNADFTVTHNLIGDNKFQALWDGYVDALNKKLEKLQLDLDAL